MILTTGTQVGVTVSSPEREFLVRSPDCRAQPVRAGVGAVHRIRVIGQDRQDRPELLFAYDRGIVVDVGDDGRRDEGRGKDLTGNDRHVLSSTITLRGPGGSSSAASSPNMHAVSGVLGAGSATRVLPLARAGAILPTRRLNG